MEKWHVAHSKPRSEELLWKQFCLRRIESYYPRIEVQPVNPRARKVQPYFPGYLFVHVDLDVVGRSAVEWVPGAVGLVCFGDEPASVSDALIASIRQRVESLGLIPEKKPFPFHKGDAVVVQDGAFAGYAGIFDVQLSGSERVRVLLSLLNRRQVAVELSASCLQLAN